MKTAARALTFTSLQPSEDKSRGTVPDDIARLIQRVVQLVPKAESDQEALTEDWRKDPAAVKRGLEHLVCFYGDHPDLALISNR